MIPGPTSAKDAMELTPDEMHIIVQYLGSGVARE